MTLSPLRCIAGRAHQTGNLSQPRRRGIMGEERHGGIRLWDSVPGFDFDKEVDLPEMNSWFFDGTHSVPLLTPMYSWFWIRHCGYGSQYACETLSMPRYKPSSVILLNFSSPENASIGLDLGKNSTVEVQEVGKNSSGSLNFTAPSQEGRYQIKMWNSSGLTLVSVTLDVATPRMSASPVSVAACEDITVAFSGAPGLDRDWIGMFPLGAPDTGYSDRQFIGGKGNGTVTFTAPSGSGSYEFRLFDGQELLSKSNSVEVSGGSSGVHVTAEPRNAHPGDVITVHFRGAPTNGAGVINMYQITTPDKFYSDSRSLGTSGCGKVTFVVRSPGTYDFRMFQDNVYRQILGMSNAVTVT